MKILAINSSLRGGKGFSKILIDQIIKGAESEGAECEIVHLAEIRMNRCIDCETCQKEGHLLKCVFHDKDDVSQVFYKMQQADLILFATPVYTFGMSSLLKTFIERYYSTANVSSFHMTKTGLFFHHTDQAICGKPFVALIVYDNLENEMSKNIIAYFKTYSKFSEAEMVGTLVRKSAGIFRTDLKEKRMSNVKESVFCAYIQAGRELAQHQKISRKTEKKANEPMIKMPFYVKPMLKLGFGKEKIIKVHGEMMKSIVEK